MLCFDEVIAGKKKKKLQTAVYFVGRLGSLSLSLSFKGRNANEQNRSHFDIEGHC